MIFAFLNQSSTFFSPFAEDSCLFQISSFFGAFFWSMFAQFPKITAHVFGCDFPSLPRKLRLPRPKFCHKFACTCEVSESAFRDEAGEGCAFPCTAARPLPRFLPFSLFPFRPSILGLFGVLLQTPAPEKKIRKIHRNFFQNI